MEAAYAERIAAIHPDALEHRCALERGFASAHALHLNDALREIGPAHARLTYLLSARGLSVRESPLLRLRADPADHMELLELRHALDELRGRDAVVERARLMRHVQGRFEGLLNELGAAVDATPEDGALPFSVGRVAHLHALRRLMDEPAA